MRLEPSFAFRMPGACVGKRTQQTCKSDGKTRVRQGRGGAGPGSSAAAKRGRSAAGPGGVSSAFPALSLPLRAGGTGAGRARAADGD